MRTEYDVEVEGKAFLLRPDTPKEGKVREPRPGEAPGELAEPLRTYATEAGLVMRRPPLVSYTVYALEATAYAKEHGQFFPFHEGKPDGVILAVCVDPLPTLFEKLADQIRNLASLLRRVAVMPCMRYW